MILDVWNIVKWKKQVFLAIQKPATQEMLDRHRRGVPSPGGGKGAQGGAPPFLPIRWKMSGWKRYETKGKNMKKQYELGWKTHKSYQESLNFNWANQSYPCFLLNNLLMTSRARPVSRTSTTKSQFLGWHQSWPVIFPADFLIPMCCMHPPSFFFWNNFAHPQVSPLTSGIFIAKKL